MDELESTWTVPVDHPAFAGPFPGQPNVPGVVLLDHAIHQAAPWLPRPDGTWRIDSAKFFHPVGPGQVLNYSLRVKPSGAVAFAVREGEGVGEGVRGLGRQVAAGVLSPKAA
jgi:3-hydroxymyristoyl/3-hydroxydecanoyl-(acyl carrier protein) dehydratase